MPLVTGSPSYEGALRSTCEHVAPTTRNADTLHELRFLGNLNLKRGRANRPASRHEKTFRAIVTLHETHYIQPNAERRIGKMLSTRSEIRTELLYQIVPVCQGCESPRIALYREVTQKIPESFA